MMFKRVKPDLSLPFVSNLERFLLSVQPESFLWSFVHSLPDAPSDSSVREFLDRFDDLGHWASFSFGYSFPVFVGYGLKKVFCDNIQENVIFLSNSDTKAFHQVCVRWLSSLSRARGIKFRRSPFASFLDGYDLELVGFNVEFESGLKKSFEDLDKRLRWSSVPVVVVCPNDVVLRRYQDHFGCDPYYSCLDHEFGLITLKEYPRMINTIVL